MTNKTPRLLAVAGNIGAGKNTVAAFLAMNFGYNLQGFADPIYEGLFRLNPPVATGHHRYEYLQTMVARIGWDTAKRRYPVIRHWLRTIGEENGRQVFGPYCWVDIAKERIQQSKALRHVFCDLRYPEEVEFIRANGGEVWQVQGRVSPEIETLPKHASEGNALEIDRIIMNDQTLPVLHRRITAIMEGFLA